MERNVAGQKLTIFAFDSTTGKAKTGDAANITCYVSKDDGAVTVLADTTATEADATNAKGIYLFDLAIGETNAIKCVYTGKSATANIEITPLILYTDPVKYTLMVIDAAGLVDANAVKVGPTGAGTAQTAKDLGASATQTGDSFVRLGAAGAGLTALGDTRIANLDAAITTRTKPADTQAAVTLVTTLTTYTGNTPQTGDSFPFANRTVIRGTVGNGSAPSTTQFTPSTISPAITVADQMKGRIIVFDNATTTAALRGQATTITTHTAGGLITYTALTTAPVNGDTFSVL